ncbi:hypothetical protein [Streptomyces sp. DSM 40907]|uniref:hypothetical protein n=1 Tax=Streptomyces kutzneri TaxID=3051179 RepID=UPI0028D5379A|nr:hypothetical protein [Streptomyces sp. DSM 40907]
MSAVSVADPFVLDVKVTSQGEATTEPWPTKTCLGCTSKCPTVKQTCTLLSCATQCPVGC